MTKSEFIKQLSAKTNLSKSKANESLGAMLDIIVDSCKSEDGIKLTGFGSFVPFKTKASRRINPQTGAPMNIPSRWVPKFRPGRVFKSSLNSN